MKKLLRVLFIAAVLTTALCVSALAADTADPGIYDIKTNNGVTITPKKADNSEIIDVDGYYANAVKFDVTASGLSEKETTPCLLLVLNEQAAPTEKNIVYINQMEADNGKVSFTDTDAAYPKELRTGTYYVYLVSEGSEFNADAPAATFQYDQKYTLGDVNGDKSIDIMDVAAALNHIVGNEILTGIRFSAADVVKDGSVDISDAAKILNYIVKNITSFD